MENHLSLTEEEFEQSVTRAVRSLPEHIRDRMENVAVVIQFHPKPDQESEAGVRDGDGVLLGLYEGVPLTERGSSYSALPDKITIFKDSIEQVAESREEIEQVIGDTVWHEVAHHFGMDEAEVRLREAERGYDH